jgi:hypothetical protein
MFQSCDVPMLAAEAAGQQAEALARHGDAENARTARDHASGLRAMLPPDVATPLLVGAVTLL